MRPAPDDRRRLLRASISATRPREPVPSPVTPSGVARAGADVRPRPGGSRRTILDCLALAALVVVSLALYVDDLGFYSDDWDFLRVMAFTSDQSLPGYVSALMENPNIRPRPLQAVHQAVLFSLFGMEPVGYHLVHAAVLAAMAVLFYLALRELGVPRLMALVVPGVFAVFPGYATGRFWFAAFGYGLAMATYFLSLYAELRAVRGTGAPRWRWKSLALLALAACGLGYEVALPFLVLTVPILLFQARRQRGAGALRGLGARRLLVLVGPNLAALAAILAYKLATAPGNELLQTVPGHLYRLFGGAVLVNFGSFGVALPQAAWWALGTAGATVAITAALVTACAFVYLWRLGPTASEATARRAWLMLAGAGVPVFVLGYGAFLTTSRFTVTSTGIGNRIHIAGAVGAVLVIVGLLGWLTALAPAGVPRRVAVNGLMALLVGSSLLVTNAMAVPWARSDALQREVIAGMSERFPTVREGTTLILDGVCPYTRSAIVFDSDWDLAGRVRLRYGDNSLMADVATTGRLWVTEDGLVASHYGREVDYPYGGWLVVYDHATGSGTVLTDHRTALATLGGETPSFAGTCPAGGESRGVPILPLDKRFGTLGL